MSTFLIGCYLIALVVYFCARPAWRHLGPCLLDSFVFGLFLFAAGSVAVWFEGLADSEPVMRMGLVAGLSGTIGSSVWAYAFRSRIAGLEFFRAADGFYAEPSDALGITLGLGISTLVSVAFLVAVFSHEHIASMLRAAILEGNGTFSQARVTISAGAEGYFAPGYVKQFRDVLVPVLCMAAVLCHGTYRHRWLFYVALVIALAAVFISGQRLVVLLFGLGLASVFLMEVFSKRERFVPSKMALPILIAIVGLLGWMTQLLGRLDAPLSPPVEVSGKVQAELHAKESAAITEKLEDVSSHLKQAENSLKAASEAKVVSPENTVRQQVAQKEVRDLQSQKDSLQKSLTKIEEASPPPVSLPETLTSSGLPRPIAIVIALLHRAIITVPRENVVTYSVWKRKSPAFGAGWKTDLAGIRPGTQTHLSNTLAGVTAGDVLGDSPLGLPTDLYHNWGWPGVVVMPLLYSLAFLWLDLLLVGRHSPLLYAAKLFMFFAIPSMYSPFFFLLYGGAVAVALVCYVILARRGALAFVGLRKSEHKSAVR